MPQRKLKTCALKLSVPRVQSSRKLRSLGLSCGEALSCQAGRSAGSHWQAPQSAFYRGQIPAELSTDVISRDR